MAVVSGRLQIRVWTDKDGNKRRNAEVVADNVYFGDSKPSDQSGYTGFVPNSVMHTAAPAQDYEPLEDDDEQLPF
jgi:single-strand DNA-binding protein